MPFAVFCPFKEAAGDLAGTENSSALFMRELLLVLQELQMPQGPV